MISLGLLQMAQNTFLPLYLKSTINCSVHTLKTTLTQVKVTVSLISLLPDLFLTVHDSNKIVSIFKNWRANYQIKCPKEPTALTSTFVLVAGRFILTVWQYFNIHNGCVQKPQWYKRNLLV